VILENNQPDLRTGEITREIVFELLTDLRANDGEDWWCPCCGPISGALVTDQRTCENCGYGVY
jgi:phage gp46-like protein